MFVLLFLASHAGAGQACREHPALAGKCFVVHGRLGTYNGNPTFRIWRIGTNRIIGITGAKPGEEPIMPRGVTCDFAFDCDIYGDFEVCPFTAEKPGVMQRVCLAGVKNRVVVRRKP